MSSKYLFGAGYDFLSLSAKSILYFSLPNFTLLPFFNTYFELTIYVAGEGLIKVCVLFNASLPAIVCLLPESN